MKRIYTLVIATILMTSFASLSLVGVGHATQADPGNGSQTTAQATKCREKYDGKTYADGSTGLQQFLDSECNANTGNCLSHNQSGSSKKVKIVCTKNPGTNAATRNNNATSPNGDAYVDPAVSASANCNKQNCSIISNYIDPLIVLLNVVVGISVLIGIIFGSLQIITSAGDPQKAANGRGHVRSALIALVAYIVLYAFLQFIIPGGV